MKTKKIKPVKLIKPIKFLVSVYVRTWFDKINGNSYYSAIIIVNGSYDTAYRIPFQYGSISDYELLKIIVSQFDFGKTITTVDDLRQDKSIVVHSHFERTTRRLCKALCN